MIIYQKYKKYSSKLEQVIYIWSYKDESAKKQQDKFVALLRTTVPRSFLNVQNIYAITREGQKSTL